MLAVAVEVNEVCSCLRRIFFNYLLQCTDKRDRQMEFQDDFRNSLQNFMFLSNTTFNLTLPGIAFGQKRKIENSDKKLLSFSPFLSFPGIDLNF